MDTLDSRCKYFSVFSATVTKLIKLTKLRKFIN